MLRRPRLSAAPALDDVFPTQVVYTWESKRCWDAMWPGHGDNLYALSEYPSLDALDDYFTQTNAQREAFAACVAASPGEACDAVITNGLDVYGPACDAADGFMFNRTSRFQTSSGGWMTQSDVVCVAKDCVNGYDLDEHSANLGGMYEAYQCGFFAAQFAAVGVLDCGVSINWDAWWAPWSDWTQAGFCVAVGLAVLLLWAAVYLPRQGGGGGGRHTFASVGPLDMESAAYAPLPDKKQDADAKPWGERIKAAWHPQRNFDSLFAAPKYTSLVGLRAWAVTCVIGLHSVLFWPSYAEAVVDGTSDGTGMGTWLRLQKLWAMQPVVHGDLAVDIFFVLSGFLLCTMAFKEVGRHGARSLGWVPRFLARRWLRIAPAYSVAFFVSWAAMPDWSTDCHDDWAYYLTFTNNVLGLPLCLSQAWSIAIEFQFYLVTPFIVAAMALPSDGRRFVRSRHRGLLVLLAVSAFSLAARAMFVLVGSSTDNYVVVMGKVYSQVYTRATPYLTGMAAAFLARDDELVGWLQGLPRGHAGLCAAHAAAAGVWAAVAYVGALPFEGFTKASLSGSGLFFFDVFARALFGLAVAYFVLMTVAGRARPLHWLLSWRVWRPLAALSYSAYLLQFLVIEQAATYMWLGDRPMGATVSFNVYVGYLTLCCAGSFALAFVLYMVVEKPVMNLRVL